MDKRIIVVGAFAEIIELCEEAGFEVIGIIDNQQKGVINGIPIIGTDDDKEKVFAEYGACGVVISPDSPLLKEKLMKNYKDVGFTFPAIISPFAHISKSAVINEGAIVQAGVNISSDVKIGSMVKLNYNVNVMHDVTIDDYCVIAPNVVLLGRSSVLSSSYIGANTTVMPNACINNHSKVKPCSIIYDERNAQ